MITSCLFSSILSATENSNYLTPPVPWFECRSNSKIGFISFQFSREKELTNKILVDILQDGETPISHSELTLGGTLTDLKLTYWSGLPLSITLIQSHSDPNILLGSINQLSVTCQNR